MRTASFFAVVLLFFSLPQVACKKTSRVQSGTAPDASAESQAVAGATTADGLRGIVHFTGEVKRGETFAKSFASNMIFRLEPYAGEDSGWSIRIVPGSDPEANSIDCIGAVSEPLHGDKNLLIEPPADGSLQKPIRWDAHEFEFVPDAANCKTAWELMNVVNYPSNLSGSEREDADNKLGQIPRGHGKLAIVDSRLGAPTADNEHGVIEWLKFDVDLTLRGPTSQPAAKQND